MAFAIMKKIVPLIAVLFLAFLTLRLNKPPEVVSDNAPDSVFSAKRAYTYLKVVAGAPHSTGTEENKIVRQYIADVCRGMGLETQMQNTTSVRKEGSSVIAANVYNVIATLKGKQGNGKRLLVMSHFDSQPNTPGAGDDGAGVAAMLEVARIITASKKTFNNDIVFLFTDAEESGLSGAQGFAQDTVMLKSIGFVLNVEGRGNSGVSMMFEVNPENGWAVRQYMQAAKYPVGNSMAYEVYKNLPNDTDYTIFRRAGISGLNSGFVDGYVNYHSPNDKPENLDLRSLQHHGDNLLGLVKHLGNISLEQTKAPDITFFNVSGYWMMSYSSSLNIVLLIACSVLLVVLIVMGFRKKQVNVKGVVSGFFIYFGTLILMLLIGFGVTKLVLMMYPFYGRFYSSNSYNSAHYFIALTAIEATVFAFMYQWLSKKLALQSLLTGVLILEVILLNLFYIVMPSAAFLLLLPILSSIIGNIIVLHRGEQEKSYSDAWIVINILCLIPAMLWLPLTISQMYTIFGLEIIAAGIALVLGILLGLMLPVLVSAFEFRPKLIGIIAAVIFVISIVTGHLTSGFDEEHPLQSAVTYQLRGEENKAFWLTRSKTTDEWSQQFFPEFEMEFGRMKSEAPLLSLGLPTATVVSDTIVNNIRLLRIHCAAGRDALTLALTIHTKDLALDATVIGPAGGVPQAKKAAGPFSGVYYTGLDSRGFDVILELTPNTPLEFTLLDRSMGLPKFDGIKDQPDWIIHGNGSASNTIQVTKKFTW
ncbi:MAG: M20/M25/M40 family metallo-hydrolase [Cyclobacteriaceae bacterium]|nr:M20/M25/M40 family metallo-hydrolase [Cyclobacteriaceae bacterium]